MNWVDGVSDIADRGGAGGAKRGRAGKGGVARPPRGSPGSVRSVNYAVSPLLASRTPAWRSRLLVALVGLAFCGLIARAAYIQIIGTPFFLKQGEIRYARTLVMPASRGRILDRNGLILASSVPAPSLWAIPKDFSADVAQRRELARLLGMTPKSLDERLDDNPNFVWLRRQLDLPVTEAVARLGIGGLHQVREFKRKYPEGEAAAHVVGFTDVEDKGQEGIELAFEEQLAGRAGSRRVIKDRLGRVVEDLGDSVLPADGRDIELSIDTQVQFFAYQRIRDAVAEHKAKAGSVVVLDAQSGQVLALANFPSYLPADRRNLTGGQLRNRALTDTFEPGSTMKPFIAGWAMETGRVTPNTVIHTAPGRLTMYGATITDSHPHGDLTVTEVIQKSSNVGATRLAMQFDRKEMWELYSHVGFGQKPQIGFPGAVTGRLRPWKSWRPIEQATMSYGYGLSASLFQIARAYTVFANDGVLLPVSLMKANAGGVAVATIGAATATTTVAPVARVAATVPRAGASGVVATGGTPVAGTGAAAPGLAGAAGATDGPDTATRLFAQTAGPASAAAAAGAPAAEVAGTRVLSAKVAQQIRAMLQMAAGPGGTAPKAQTIGYSVGGKSGTAYKQEGKGYASKKYRSWFVGMAPITHPRVIVAVMVDEPSNGKWFGGDVAAPVFSEVVQQTLRTLGVPPDIEVRPQIVTSNTPAVDESF